MGKKHNKIKSQNNHPPKGFKLSLPRSLYSIQYANYMQKQYPSVELLIKKIIKLPFCSEFYLKYPLEGMMRGVCKKMMINLYQVTIYGYFLSVCQWGLDAEVFGNLYELFPDIIHINEPTDSNKMKQLSMFLYFSCYSVKQLLNSNMDIFRNQMIGIFPQFQHLHAYWVNGQQTTNFILNPKNLNSFYNLINLNDKYVDYNVTIDKIIQISPCYDINGKIQKKKLQENGQKYQTQFIGKRIILTQEEGQGFQQHNQMVKEEFIHEQYDNLKLNNIL